MPVHCKVTYGSGRRNLVVILFKYFSTAISIYLSNQPKMRSTLSQPNFDLSDSSFEYLLFIDCFVSQQNSAKCFVGQSKSMARVDRAFL